MAKPDPTYVTAAIDANPAWRLAFRLSEIDNDNAPIGWGDYITLANWLIRELQPALDDASTAKAFLHESGTDPEAWLDSAIDRLRLFLLPHD